MNTEKFVLVCMVTLWWVHAEIGLAQGTANHSRASDGLALDVVFAQQHVSESGIWACDHARTFEPPQRFEFLLNWVLPNEQHDHFRVTADFASETVASTRPADAEQDASALTDTDHDSQIVSPAIDLIQLARQLDQTRTLRDRITACPISQPRDLCDQTAMLALLAINQNETDRARALLEEYFQLLPTDNPSFHDSRDAVLLCADQVSRSLPLSAIVLDSTQRIIRQNIGEVNRTAWHRHLWATHAELFERLQRRQSGPSNDGRKLSQWYQVSRTRAFEHGSAFPAARWRFDPGSVRNLSSHGDDFLFFASPLRGDFDVETGMTPLGAQDTQLMIGGIWIAPTSDRQAYTFGSVRGQLQRVGINPRLFDTNGHGSIHCRTRIKDGVATTYFNGRKIHQQALGPFADPWLAIRSDYRHDGGVDDLRITGTPTIPETILMVDSPQLLGWYDYYQPPRNNKNRLADWKGKLYNAASDNQQIAEITSLGVKDLPSGTSAERLLVYTRPILEDGTIQYEFWFAAGETTAHPAVGRTCFLIQPDGVKLHRMTDGRFERSILRPDNRTVARREDAQSRKLPLRPNAWNEMRLEVKADLLTLTLNGQSVYQHNLRPEHRQRNFGLFHYADQGDLRVRNPRWTGDWPKQLPAIENQELAVYANRFLDQTADALSEVLTHRFDALSIATRKFMVVEGDPIKNIRATDDGLFVFRDGEDGYRDTKIAPAAEVGGDFDVTVSYDQLKLDSGLERIGSLRLQVNAKNDLSDLAMIQRGETRGNEPMIECMKAQTIQGTQRRHYFANQPMECEAGRLRLSRRGDQIYYLVAENDSMQFRLIGQDSFATDDLPELGISFGVQIQGPDGRAQVRVKEFELRAERLTGLATDDQQTLLAKLNAQREQLPVSFQHNFVTAAPDKKDFDRWTDATPWDASAGGLIIDSPGSDDWTSAGIAIRRPFSGNFDVSFSFRPLKLATPKTGDRTQVYLQIELNDKGHTQLSSMLTKSDAGDIAAQAQKRTPSDDGYHYQSLGTLAIAKFDRLRVARRGKKVHFIAGTASDPQEYLLGSTNSSEAPINYYGVRMILHTGGGGRASQMLLRSIDVKAEQEAALVLPRGRSVPRTVDLESRPKPSRRKSLLDSVRDLFQ